MVVGIGKSMIIGGLYINKGGATKMKIDMLGKYGGVPGEDMGCSSFLLSSGKGSVLFECGSGVVSKLIETIDIEDLKAVVISHLHFDHFNDIFTLYYLYKVESRINDLDRIKVYLPRTPLETVEFITNNLGDVFDFIFIDETTHLTLLENIDITFCRTKHDIETYAMRIEDTEVKLGYTADTGYSEKLISFFKGAEILIAESSLISDLPKNDNHMTSYEAVKMEIEVGAEAVILTHFWYSIPMSVYMGEVKEFEDKIAIGWV